VILSGKWTEVANRQLFAPRRWKMYLEDLKHSVDNIERQRRHTPEEQRDTLRPHQVLIHSLTKIHSNVIESTGKTGN
jgi:hypothetical protein